MRKHWIDIIGALISILLLASCELQEPDADALCNAQGSLLCGGSCVSITTEQYCGSCQKACAGGEVCLQKGGVYDCYLSEPKCADDEHKFCNGQCVDTTTKEHCGGCDPCKRYQRCEAVSGKYQCVDDCKSPSLICGNACVSPSRENCGECGNACGEDRICKKDGETYRCVVENCNKPEVLTPDGACVLPNTPFYCGDEAKPCPEERGKCLPKDGKTQSFYCRDNCENGVKDPDEVGIDCGGRCKDKACKLCSVNTNKLPCDEGEFCDSAAGYVCTVKCRPDNGKPNTRSKDCMGEDRICRADGRCSSKYFVTEWYLGDEKSLDIELFHDGKGDCDFNVDWGDGKKERIKGCTPDKLKHRYAEKGVYRVKIDGVYDGWGWKDYDKASKMELNAYKLRKVLSFGPVGLTSFGFRNCVHLSHIPSDDVPDASKLIDTAHMFAHHFSDETVTIFNQPVEHWDVSNVTTMNSMFFGAKHFNQPVERWDVSKVTDMSEMFWQASKFNQPLGRWDVSNVENMHAMLAHAISFDQPIGAWNVSKVTNMGGTFAGAKAFNQDISKWDVSNVDYMGSLFAATEKFNQDISRWNVSKVESMNWMFSNSKVFNRDISRWDVSNVRSMYEMFRDAKAFDRELSRWNVSKVEDMADIFKNSAFSLASYCKTLKNGDWKKFTETMGISYTCP